MEEGDREAACHSPMTESHTHLQRGRDPRATRNSYLHRLGLTQTPKIPREEGRVGGQAVPEAATSIPRGESWDSSNDMQELYTEEGSVMSEESATQEESEVPP